MNFEFPIQELPAVMRGRASSAAACWSVAARSGARWSSRVPKRASCALDDGRLLDAERAHYLPPVRAQQDHCRAHLVQLTQRRDAQPASLPTETPTYFTKPPTALNGHGGQLLRPADCRYLNYEGEFAAVIGKTVPQRHARRRLGPRGRLLPGPRRRPPRLS